MNTPRPCEVQTQFVEATSGARALPPSHLGLGLGLVSAFPFAYFLHIYQTPTTQTHAVLFTARLANKQSWLSHRVLSINLEILTESQSTGITSMLWSAGEFIYHPLSAAYICSSMLIQCFLGLILYVRTRQNAGKNHTKRFPSITLALSIPPASLSRASNTTAS
jgi:hypothetical protein